MAFCLLFKSSDCFSLLLLGSSAMVFACTGKRKVEGKKAGADKVASLHHLKHLFDATVLGS